MTSDFRISCKMYFNSNIYSEVPNELLEMGFMVNVDVEDHRHEDYKRKPATLKSFKGSGQTLGRY